MKEISPGIYRIEPSKITPTKYISFFVTRKEGNLLFPCLSSASTFETQWSEIHDRGGIVAQLIGDMHFATKHCDLLHSEFGTPVQCSEVEAPDVQRKVEAVQTFPFNRHKLMDGVVVIPTPGHRPGAVGYLVSLPERDVLFIGDSIWHDGTHWKALSSKKNRATMLNTLESLKDEKFSAMYGNSSVQNDVCSVEFSSDAEKQTFLEELVTDL